MSTRILVGDALSVLRTLPSASVHCCVTSPPYWNLRDYGMPGQIGLEPTPEDWVASMVAVFREVHRVLREDATCWINVGDAYCGSGKGPTGHNGVQNAEERQGFVGGPLRQPTSPSGPHVPAGWSTRSTANRSLGMAGYKAKDLIGLPWMLAFALRADGWYLRSEIIWAKPNPMPESVTDRPTKAHEQLFLLSKSRTYYFDQEAVREPQSNNTHSRGNGTAQKEVEPGLGIKSNSSFNRAMAGYTEVPGGRNIRSVWTVATEAFPESHFATYPTALIEPCIKAGTSERGCCPECGAPWVRVVEREKFAGSDTRTPGAHTPTGNGKLSGSKTQEWLDAHPPVTTGWRPSCKHEGESQPATVLDPFFGAGTTGLVADRLKRDCIGIELNPEYAAMAQRRINGESPMFSDVSVA